MRSPFLGGLALVVVAATSWGFWSLFLRPSGLPASLTAPLVLLVMGVTMLPFMAVERAAWDRRSVLLLLALGASDALNIATFFAAMEATTLGVAVLTHYLAPLLVALLAPLLDGERVRGARRAALVATLGLALVLEPWNGASEGRWWGAALGACSAVGYAGNVFCTARLVPRVGAARSVGLHSLLSAALLLPWASSSAWEAVTPRGIALVVAGGVTLGAISGWMFSKGVPRVGPTLASTLAFLEPLVAVVVGWLAWGEEMSPAGFAGAALMVGAGAWVTRARAGAGVGAGAVGAGRG